MKYILMFILGILVILAGFWIITWQLCTIWTWFIVSTTNFMPISFWTMFGFICIFSIMTNKYRDTSEEEDFEWLKQWMTVMLADFLGFGLFALVYLMFVK